MWYIQIILGLFYYWNYFLISFVVFKNINLGVIPSMIYVYIILKYSNPNPV